MISANVTTNRHVMIDSFVLNSGRDGIQFQWVPVTKSEYFGLANPGINQMHYLQRESKTLPLETEKFSMNFLKGWLGL